MKEFAILNCTKKNGYIWSIFLSLPQGRQFLWPNLSWNWGYPKRKLLFCWWNSFFLDSNASPAAVSIPLNCFVPTAKWKFNNLSDVVFSVPAIQCKSFYLTTQFLPNQISAIHPSHLLQHLSAWTVSEKETNCWSAINSEFIRPYLTSNKWHMNNQHQSNH